MDSRTSALAALTTLLLVVGSSPDSFSAAAPEAFFDALDALDTQRWQRSDGWTNGAPFGCGWRADHVEFSGGLMSLRLDDQPCAGDSGACSGEPYACGEYWTREHYPYGRVEARFRAARGEGLVTSLFTYTGPSDGNPHDEIDIEIIGRDPTTLEVNFYTNGQSDHWTRIPLGFDAAAAFHDYAFEWTPQAVQWFVDGELVHTVTAQEAALPSTPGRVMVNLWCGTGVDEWLGTFVYPGSPVHAEYDWIRYVPAPIFVDGFESGDASAWSGPASSQP